MVELNQDRQLGGSHNVSRQGFPFKCCRLKWNCFSTGDRGVTEKRQHLCLFSPPVVCSAVRTPLWNWRNVCAFLIHCCNQWGLIWFIWSWALPLSVLLSVSSGGKESLQCPCNIYLVSKFSLFPPVKISECLTSTSHYALFFFLQKPTPATISICSCLHYCFGSCDISCSRFWAFLDDMEFFPQLWLTMVDVCKSLWVGLSG